MQQGIIRYISCPYITTFSQIRYDQVLHISNDNRRDQWKIASAQKTYSNEKKREPEACPVCIKSLMELYRNRQSTRRRKLIKEIILMWDNMGTVGVVSMYSTLFWANQCKALISNNVVTIARNETENSCRKIVIANSISMISLLDCSFNLSTSASRREPRNTRLINCHKTHIITKPMLRSSTKLILEVDK